MKKLTSILLTTLFSGGFLYSAVSHAKEITLQFTGEVQINSCTVEPENQEISFSKNKKLYSSHFDQYKGYDKVFTLSFGSCTADRKIELTFHSPDADKKSGKIPIKTSDSSGPNDSNLQLGIKVQGKSNDLIAQDYNSATKEQKVTKDKTTQGTNDFIFTARIEKVKENESVSSGTFKQAVYVTVDYY